MKKLFAIVVLALLVSAINTLSAQEFRANAGLEIALPIGDFADLASFGFGFSGGGELPVGDNLGITGTLGYTILSVNGDLDGFIKNISMIPVQFGAKYYFSEQQSGAYGHAQVGLHSVSIKSESVSLGIFGNIGGETTSETDLSYAIGGGYFINENIDLGLRFNGIAADESLSYIGFRGAFNF